MENRKSNYTGPRRRSSAPDPIFHLLFSIFCFCALLGCAAPGEPTYRHPPVPEAIGDLAARPVGDAVVLTFTLPRNTIEHRPLAEPPAVEIFRGMIPKGARSEEHTSELQSRGHLVCRLLLEKKKKNSNTE